MHSIDPSWQISVEPTRVLYVYMPKINFSKYLKSLASGTGTWGWLCQGPRRRASAQSHLWIVCIAMAVAKCVCICYH